VQTVIRLLEIILLAWFAALMALIAVRILRGDIGVSGFLAHSNDLSEPILPERVIAMAAFSTIVIGYMVYALHADVSGPNPMLPNIPDSVVTLFTGSNSIYIAGKIARN
jgi:hypothetical protein